MDYEYYQPQANENIPLELNFLAYGIQAFFR
jgi:hypothetical protein